MKTKLLSLFLVAIAAINLSASNTQVDGIWYDFDLSTKTASVTYRGNSCLDYNYEYSGSVVIPEIVTYDNITYSVTTIGDGAFGYCKGLTSVTIPNSVTTIGTWAFEGCYGLTSVTIPNSVTTIGDRAFFGCTGLTSINVDAANTHYCSIDGVLFNYAKDTLIQYPIGNTRTEYTIPNSVTTIGEDAFRFCSSLKSITIPNSVTTIGEYAFYGCSGLTSITIPNSVTTIENETFNGCSSLTSVTIGKSVTTIGEWAFAGCSGLTSITIPNSVTTIGYMAFVSCRGLTSITCEAITPPTCDSRCFYDVNKSIPVYVPAQSISAYKNAEGWKEFTNIQGICDGEPYFNVQDTTVCGNSEPFVWEGDSIYYGGKIKYRADSGYYYNHFEKREVWSSEERIDTFTRNYISAGGCDSTLMLVVHYYPSYYEVLHLTIEEGDSIIYLSGKWITETGVYYDTLISVPGCDSLQEYRVYVKPKPTYVVTLSVNNTKYGSVEGGGTYKKNDTVNLVAIPNKGYQFNQWSDGVTTNPRTIYSIDKDYTLTAQFGIKQCSWLVESNDLEMGAVSTTFTNEYYNYGTQITVEASANSGYKFVKWNDGKKYNPYKFSLLDDKYLLAIFMADEEEMDTTQVQPSDTTATFTWPFIIGGFTYTLTIYLDAACTIPFCTLTFNQYGQLISITFGARAPRRSALAGQEEGFTTTINGLSANTQYYFKMETKDEEGKLINTDEGTFETKVNVPTDINHPQSTIHNPQKYLHNGQLVIDRNGQHYSAMGERIR